MSEVLTVNDSQSMRDLADAMSVADVPIPEPLPAPNSAPDKQPKGPHHLSVKAIDWLAEANNVAQSLAFAYGNMLDAPRTSIGSDIEAPTYTLTGHNYALWTRATEAERRAVVEAFTTNSVVQRVEMVNALVTDTLGQAWEGVLSRNSSITALNLESNSISSG